MSNKIIKKKERTTHTAWGMYLQSLAYLGLPFQTLPHTTLNEKFNIHTAGRYEANERPQARYFVIGRGGHQYRKSSSGVDIPDPVGFDPRSASLYDPIPLVLRRKEDDLTPEERSNYRLRCIRSFGGVEYIAYYAKRFNVDSVPQVLIESVTDGKLTQQPYVPSEANLSPQKPAIAPNTRVPTAKERITVNTGAEIHLTQQDLQEIINVCVIIYGSYDEAIVSEIGIVAGVDDAHYVSPDDSVTYTELKGATICSFISTLIALMYHSEDYIEKLAAGDGIPLLTNSALFTTLGVDGP